MSSTRNRATIKLYNVEGIARLSGNTEKDGNGAYFEQVFYEHLEDSAISLYWESDTATEEKALKGAWRSCLEHCAQCGRRIVTDAWICTDGGEFYCARHVKIMTRA